MFVWKMTFFEKYFSLCSVLVGVHNLWREGKRFGLLRTELQFKIFWGVEGRREYYLILALFIWSSCLLVRYGLENFSRNTFFQERFCLGFLQATFEDALIARCLSILWQKILQSITVLACALEIVYCNRLNLHLLNYYQSEYNFQ